MPGARPAFEDLPNVLPSTAPAGFRIPACGNFSGAALSGFSSIACGSSSGAPFRDSCSVVCGNPVLRPAEQGVGRVNIHIRAYRGRVHD